MNRRYDFASLAAAMGLSEHQACKQLGISGSTEQQYRREGMSRDVAERRADRAGFHVYEVWPEMVDHDLEAITRTCAARGCEETFELSLHGGPNRLYCSKKCKSRENRRRHYHRNPEPQRERHRRYLEETADYQRKARRRRYEQNAEEERAKRRERYRLNAEKEKAAERERKARKRAQAALLAQLEAEQVPASDRHLVGLSPVRDVSHGVSRSICALDGGSTKKEAA